MGFPHPVGGSDAVRPGTAIAIIVLALIIVGAAVVQLWGLMSSP